MTEHKRIYSAGPSITEKEHTYVLDAVKNGWYANYQDYKIRFEKTFADYVGAKYSFPTFCCSSALSLSLAAAGIDPGDEVILPEITWVACANAVAQLGATPVFVDVEEGSWTLDVESLKKAITEKTKAIMPVHSYGHPCDMDAINAVANELSIHVIEDAAPSVGSLYKGRKTGTLSDIGSFSFQGAKILVTGEGGMITTNDEALFNRVCSLASHGRDESVRPFFSKEIGTKSTMANILAALGLAQLERVDELVTNKRRLHDLYESRLGHIDGISIFKEKEGYFSNCSYPSITLSQDFPVTRDALISGLKERSIDTRPVFPCLSKFPCFHRRSDNPVADFVESHALNLPCAHNITEQDVDIIVQAILEIAGI